MTQGRKPQATSLRLVTGNAGKRKVNQREPRPKAQMPTAPSFLSREAKAEWKRVAKALDLLGILTLIDRTILAAYCQAYGRWVQAENALAKMAKADSETSGLTVKTSNGNAIQNPLVGTANKAAKDMAYYAAELGMTPSARTRLEIGIDNPHNPGQKEEGAGRFFR